MKHVLKEVRKSKPGGQYSIRSYRIYRCQRCGRERDERFDFQNVDCVDEKNWRMAE